MWQDYIIAIGQTAFIVAQVVNIAKPQKPPVASCAITAFWLWVFTGVFYTLALPWTTATSAIGAFNWTVLLVQARRR